MVASRAAAVAWSVVQVLVTGASGAIGAELVPRLARGGHAVRAFAREPSRVTAMGVTEIVRGDAVTGAGLDEALAGIDVAYFLIHSMETALNGAGTFADRDREAARRFAAAARGAGVRRVVYLGGLVPADAPASPHLASRLEVEEALLGAAPRRSRCAPRSSSQPVRAPSASSCASSSACRSCRCRRGATIARDRSTGAT